MPFARVIAWNGRLRATQARSDGLRPAFERTPAKRNPTPSNALRPALILALPALLIGPGMVAAETGDFQPLIPPGYGEPASKGRAGTNQLAASDQAISAPLGGHSLQLGPGAALSWSGVTLYHHASYPEDPTDGHPDFVLAPGFTPLLLGPGSQPGGLAPARGGLRRQGLNGGGTSSPRRSRGTFGLSQSLGPLDIAVTGDYGRYKLPVRPELDLSKEEKLMRLGANLGLGGFQVRGSMGAEIKPFEIGNTLAWDLAATYSEGPWAFGLAYTHALLADAPNDEEVDTLGTLQSGVRYAIAPGMSAGAHAMFWSFSDEDSRAATDVAGVLSFSLQF